MLDIKKDGKFNITKEKLIKIKKDFISADIKETEVLKIIKEVYEKYQVILDPHTAIGFGATYTKDLQGDIVALATAHPCKFPDAIKKANETARRELIHIPLRDGRTIHHDVYGKDGAGKIVLRSAPKGTGIRFYSINL